MQSTRALDISIHWSGELDSQAASPLNVAGQAEMTTHILVFLTSVLALAGRAFFWSVLNRFDENRQLPSRPEQLRKAANAFSHWIGTGKNQGLIDDIGEVVSKDLEALEQ
jgi:hypothetical protein